MDKTWDSLSLDATLQMLAEAQDRTEMTAATETALKHVRALVDDYYREAAKLEAAEEFSDVGKARQLATLSTSYMERLHRLTDSVLASARSGIANFRSTLADPVPSTGDKAADETKMEGIRQRTAGMDLLRLQERYMDAAMHGDGWFCRALEEQSPFDSPFGPSHAAELFSQGRKARIERNRNNGEAMRGIARLETLVGALETAQRVAQRHFGNGDAGRLVDAEGNQYDGAGNRV